MSNLMIFEGKEVEVFELNGQVLFNPYHCGQCLDLAESTVRYHLANMNSKQAVLLKNSDVQNINIRNLNNAGEKFLTESGVYKLIFKSKKSEAEKFQDWVTDEVLPQIRKTGSYMQAKVQYTVTPKEELECLDVVSGILNFNDNSKLLGVKSIYDKYGMETSYLPAYAPSKGILKSATELLKQFNVGISAIEFNKKLVKLGILKECTRQSSKDKTKVKKFKNLVDTTWGENQVNTKNQKETQPLYYEDKFADLLKKLGI